VASGGPQAPVKPEVISPARRAAFDILLRVEAGEGHSDDLLHSELTRRLSEQDRGLATALVMDCLRWWIELDALLQPMLQRPDQRLDEPVALALRLGALQLLHMDRIPPHAALNESVALCRVSGHPHAAGMVNAILRRVTQMPPRAKKIFETTAGFAERLGHPVWLVERWVAAYGRDAALRVCEADQREPAEGVLFDAVSTSDGSPTSDTALPHLDDGSRLVAEIAAAACTVEGGGRVAGKGVRVWDCCAAPGGKTVVLRARLPNAMILATDLSKRRLESMRRRLRALVDDGSRGVDPSGDGRLIAEAAITKPSEVSATDLEADVTSPSHAHSESLRFAVADARALPEEEGSFDLILCDVPCSGTGTLGRNPEIRLRLLPKDLARQAERQREILAATLARLAPGGRLVYSTCSLEPEECAHVVDAVLALHPQLKLVPVEEVWARVPDLKMDLLGGATVGGCLRTLPGTHPGDGFYAAIIERPL
jgi:16S rRNA (cytosine967-C5)-methyltransferase